MEKTRPALGAELFIAETLVDVLADLGDGAYDSEVPSSGMITGQRFTDMRGTWTVASSLSYEEDDENAVGWFRTSESNGVEMTADDVKRHVSLFGKSRAYAFMIDPSQSSFAIFTVEDGVAVKVRALVSENY